MSDLIDPALWKDAGGLIGLVILALFVLLGLVMLSVTKKIDDVRPQIEQLRRQIMDLKLTVETSKNTILKTFYEAGVLPDRRRNKRDT